MQYVWAQGLWDRLKPMHTVDGSPVSIIDRGRLNRDAGPDFFNAKVRIGDEIWAGNIEIHVKASDWYRHGHDSDEAYDSVILHVVQVNDREVTRRDGHVIAQMVMECNPYLRHDYDMLTGNSTDYTLPCGSFIPDIPEVYITSWLQRLGMERLMTKVSRIRDILRQTGGDYDQAAYATLARAMGSGINGDSFQALAMSAPLKTLTHVSDSAETVEGILFGQAKMLEVQCDEPYYGRLCREYAFFMHKYGLHQSQGVNWKLSRMRPAALPHRRIALLATLVRTIPFMTDRLISIRNLDEARDLFSRPLDGFWASHYTFSTPEQAIMPQALSQATINSLVINAIIPLQYTVALSRGDDRLGESALELLTSLPRENNRIVTTFNDAGIKCPDAFTSQAFIQLRNEYCLQRKCLYCHIGHRWLSTKATKRMGVCI